MIPDAGLPIAGAVRFREHRVHGFRLSIPIFLLWIVFAPLMLLVVPMLFVASLLVRVNPFKAVAGIFRILAALKGTHVEVMNDNLSLLLNIF